MYALRPILAGEEITKTYVDPSLPRSERIAHLQENYGFTCDCQWCNLPTTSSSLDSDATRAALRIRLLTHPSYPKWSTDLARADDVVLNSHFDALQLIEQEGMHGLQGIYLEEIALCYAILGDEDRFRMWAERLVRRCKVEDSKLANQFESYLDDVRRFKRWAWRKVQRKRESSIYSTCFRKDSFLRDRNARKESACTTPSGGLVLAIFIRSAGVGSWAG